MNDVQQAHPPRNQLIQFSLGKLDSEESAAIEEHIASCDACCQIIRSLPNDTLVEMLQNIGTVSDPGAAIGKSNSDPAVQPTNVSGNPSNDGLLEIDPHEDVPGGEEAQGMFRASAMADIPEELINHPRYRILGLLGKGGMGNVYRAEHRLMERQVAIKVMNGQLLDRPEAVERFRREVKTAAKLVHPNIVTAFDAEQAGNRHLLVMEYVDGKDLAREIQQSGPMPVEEACLCIRQAALGLEHAHQRGMVHRDIKPQNLIRSGGGAVKILDLGLAHLATETIPSGTFVEGPGNLTDLHTMLGTPDYISPEQTEDAHRADIRSDIYSLGATFYYLLTGQPPFSKGSVVEKLAAHANQAPPELNTFRNDVPEGVVKILQRMMAKNPADRYQTPAELADAIRPWCGDSDPAKILMQQHPAPKRIRPPIQKLSEEAPPWRVPRWLKGTLAAATAAVAVVASVLILRTLTGTVQILVDQSVQDEPKDAYVSMAMDTTTGQQDSEPAKQNAALPADDRADYFTIPLHELPLLDGALPEPDPTAQNIFRFHRLANAIFPYAILDGPGEASIHMERSGWRLSGDAIRNATLAIRVPDQGNPEISGRILLPSPDWNGLVVRKFKINRGELKSDKQAYLKQQLAYYQELLRRDIPGAAWFRHQVQVVQKALGDTSLISQPDPSQTNRNRESELEQSFALLSGGRAVSENLQLDRLLPATAPEDQMVDMDSIQGITVRQFDWLELVKGLDPELDPLASLVPHDQHAIFFRSFGAMVDLVDNAAVQGTPILQLAEPRGEDARTQKRYEAQLGLPLGTLARSLGPQVIESVALTGADPYLRTGADVAFLFEPKANMGLMELIQAQVALNAKGYPQATSVRGEVDGVAYTGFCTPDRSLCSYQATIGKTIIVTNSLAQLRRLGTVALGKSPSLASLPEYTFFRDRYLRSGGQETALLVISDPTIRRWCGPRWRIGASRRVQAGAVMTDLVAQHLDQLVRGQIHPPADLNQEKTRQIGSWSLLSTGVRSSIYNTLEFQTPILELDLNRATQAEVSMYNRWREGYQQNWSRFFDPIAVQFRVQPDKLAADVTVMPLIDRSRYREMDDITRGAKIGIEASDQHAEALLHAAVSINKDSQTVKRATNFAMQMAPQFQVDPFAWMGETVAIYVDEDPFWAELAQSELSPENYLEQHIHQLPVALHAEVVSGFKLTAFLASLRAWIEQTSPGMTNWETRQYGDEAYVKVAPSKKALSSDDVSDELAVYYAATGESLIVTLNEKMLHRSIDRLLERRRAKAEGKPLPPIGRPWLGDNVGVQVKKEVIEFLSTAFGDHYQQMMQVLAWNNLPILNEWKKRYPDRDPVEIHERFWQRRLVCPSGGTYQWNESWQTMESTVYGHPGEPKQGPTLPVSMKTVKGANFGLTFEANGLRARMELERGTGTP